MEGICGRMCDACTWKEQLDCPGCQDGPGRRFSGGCPIADCCREKGHTACVTCTFSTGCALRRRDMPQNRLWAVEAERERRARLDPECPCAGQVAVAAVLAGDSQCFQQHSDHGYCGGSGFQLPESLEMCWHF